MLRECMEREVLAKILLDDDRFFQMFEFIVLDSFDISSDAHRTFRVSDSITLKWSKSGPFDPKNDNISGDYAQTSCPGGWIFTNQLW